MENRTNSDRSGICYGCQLLAWLINDKNVSRGEAREYGETDLTIHKVGDPNGADRLFDGFGDTLHGKIQYPANIPVFSLRLNPFEVHVLIST